MTGDRADMLRFGELGVIPGEDGEDRENKVADVSNQTSHEPRDFESCVRALREDIIGQHGQMVSPAAAAVFPDPMDRYKVQRNIVYTDFTATGRALSSIENFIADQVLPLHGNTHTVATATARQSTYFRNEARDVIANYFNCTHEDAVIFTGNGATGALDKFVGMLVKSGGFNVNLEPCGTDDAPNSEQQQIQRYFSEDRWHSCQCTLCGVRVKSESGFRAHVWSPLHQERLRQKKTDSASGAGGTRAASPGSGRRRVVIMVDPVSAQACAFAHIKLRLAVRSND